MKGEIIYRILNSLNEAALDQVDFFNAFIRSGYGATGSKVMHELSKIQDKRISAGLKKEKIKSLKNYLYKLKSQGLILENNSNQIYLSEKGKNKLNNFKNSFSLNRDLYKKKMGETVIVISYDIPITFNRERNVLRDMLATLGFSLVHKSVWVGKVLLPERFISDLSRLGIIDYVEILEVTKNGTLKSID